MIAESEPSSCESKTVAPAATMLQLLTASRAIIFSAPAADFFTLTELDPRRRTMRGMAPLSCCGLKDRVLCED